MGLLGCWQVKSHRITVRMEPWLKWNTLFELKSPVVFSDGFDSVEKLNQWSCNSNVIVIQNPITYFALFNLVYSPAVFLN